MFGRSKAKLSLLFNQRAITTRRFEKRTFHRVRDWYSGWIIGSVPDYSRLWAEATPVGKDQYTVAVKILNTHHWSGYGGRSSLETLGNRSGIFKGERKTLLTRDEAIELLRAEEKDFEKRGYTPSAKQPFKDRICTHPKAPAPKVA